MIYAAGSVVLTLGAIPVLNLPTNLATIGGLVLIAVGTGGIKPNVSAFGGDQFKLPEQAKHLATFFSLFYLSINAGSMISTLLTPILRENVHCFGELSCYSLAFGVPGALMLIAIGKFTFIHPHKFESNEILSLFVSILHSNLFDWQTILCADTAIGQYYRENYQMYGACVQNSVKRAADQAALSFS